MMSLSAARVGSVDSKPIMILLTVKVQSLIIIIFIDTDNTNLFCGSPEVRFNAVPLYYISVLIIQPPVKPCLRLVTYVRDLSDHNTYAGSIVHEVP